MHHNIRLVINMLKPIEGNNRGIKRMKLEAKARKPIPSFQN
jgi:hypothetical protein